MNFITAYQSYTFLVKSCGAVWKLIPFLAKKLSEINCRTFQNLVNISQE